VARIVRDFNKKKIAQEKAANAAAKAAVPSKKSALGSKQDAAPKPIVPDAQLQAKAHSTQSSE
jgi:hypothetical protein